MDMELGLTRAIIKECSDRGMLRNQVAYVLATGYHESAHTMRPIKETVMAHHKDKFPSDGVVIGRLNRWYKTKSPNVTPYWRDGWFGRGLVQITHFDNYKRVGKAIGVDLASDPSAALDDKVAIDVLITGMDAGLFTGKRLDDYVTLQKSDFVGARRVVNGTDKDDEIADIARKYDAALLDEGYGIKPKVERDNVMQTNTARGATTTGAGLALQQAGENLSIVAADIPNEWGQYISVVGSLIAAAGVVFLIYNRYVDFKNGDR